VGAGGSGAFGVAPSVVPDLVAFVEVSRTGESVVSPSLRAGLDYGTSGDTNVPGVAGGLNLVHTVGTLDGCPVVLRPGPFRLSPCVRFEAGAVSASGVGLVPDRSAVRPWAAAGALGLVRYVTPFRGFVELSGGVRAPFVRDRFYFEPDTTAFRASAVNGFVGAALGFTIL
jgi:hypothetical protein